MIWVEEAAHVPARSSGQRNQGRRAPLDIRDRAHCRLRPATLRARGGQVYARKLVSTRKAQPFNYSSSRQQEPKWHR